MAIQPSTVERAYELAKSGECANLDEIRHQLTLERYENITSHLMAPALSRELRALCRASKMPPAPETKGQR